MTSESTHPPMDCQSARVELAALLYGDLDDGPKVRVESHLASCPECRAEFEAHRKTLQFLNAWTINEQTSVSVGQSGRPRRKLAWARPLLVGSAAAALVFAVLGALGGEVRYDRGRLTLSIGRADVSRPETAPDLSRFAADLSTEFRGEVNGQFAALVTALDANLADLTRQQEVRRVLLLRALDERYFKDLQMQNQMLAGLVRRFETESMTNNRRFEHISMLISAPGAVRQKDEQF